jgi:hypothetical protein
MIPVEDLKFHREPDGEDVMPLSKVLNEDVHTTITRHLDEWGLDSCWVFIGGHAHECSCGECDGRHFHAISTQTGDPKFSREEFEETCHVFLDEHPDGHLVESFDAFVVGRNLIHQVRESA